MPLKSEHSSVLEVPCPTLTLLALWALLREIRSSSYQDIAGSATASTERLCSAQPLQYQPAPRVHAVLFNAKYLSCGRTRHHMYDSVPVNTGAAIATSHSALPRVPLAGVPQRKAPCQMTPEPRERTQEALAQYRHAGHRPVLQRKCQSPMEHPCPTAQFCWIR